MRHRILTAFFGSRSDADGALSQLARIGVPDHDVSVLPKYVARRDDIGLRTASKASEGAALGALAGGLLGAGLGALLAAGSIIVPGLSLVVAGPIVAALAGAGALGGLGTIVGAVVGATLPEYEARYLGDAIRMGGALVAVRCSPDRTEALEELLEASGARSIRKTAAK